MISSIGAASSEVVRSSQTAPQGRKADSLESRREESNEASQAASDDAVVVSIESRVTDVEEADSLAQSVSGAIREGGSESLDAQSEPEPRLVQDLLA